MSRAPKLPPVSAESEILATVIVRLSTVSDAETGGHGFDDWWLGLGREVRQTVLAELEQELRSQLVRLGLVKPPTIHINY
jgi:hypothetical protein